MREGLSFRSRMHIMGRLIGGGNGANREKRLKKLAGFCKKRKTERLVKETLRIWI